MLETNGSKPSSKRIRIFERDNYAVDIEYNKEFLIIHLPYLWKFDKGIYLDMLFASEDLAEFFGTLGYPCIYAAVDSNNLKIKRLLDKLKFKRIAVVQDYDVFKRGL